MVLLGLDLKNLIKTISTRGGTDKVGTAEIFSGCQQKNGTNSSPVVLFTVGTTSMEVPLKRPGFCRRLAHCLYPCGYTNDLELLEGEQKKLAHRQFKLDIETVVAVPLEDIMCMTASANIDKEHVAAKFWWHWCCCACCTIRVSPDHQQPTERNVSIQVEYLKYSAMDQSTASRISGKEGSAELTKRYGIKTETLTFKLYHADNKHEVPDASFATLSPADFRICFDEAKALCMAVTQLKASSTKPSSEDIAAILKIHGIKMFGMKNLPDMQEQDFV